jgi:spore coat polysaccharide biosynthesis protein SpsF
MRNSIGVIVQARMGSTRLPGKILMPVLGRSLLSYQIERLKLVSSASKIIIATSINEVDNPIVDLAKEHAVSVFRGSEKDVLSRFYEAASSFKIDTIVRCNSDCPLIDPSVVDLVIDFYLSHPAEFDYVSNILVPTFPTGMHTEIFSFESLKIAHLNALDPLEREHVTPYIYRRPDVFSLKGIELSDKNYSHHRWTVDYPEDFVLVKFIIEQLYPKNRNFTMYDVINLMEKFPKMMINSNIIKNHTI